VGVTEKQKPDQGSPPWGCGLVFGLPGLFCLWIALTDAKTHADGTTLIAVIAGIVFILMGLIPTLAGLGVIPTDDSDWGAPRWMGVVAGLMFMGAGFLLLMSSQQKQFPRIKNVVTWFGTLFVLFAFTGFAAMGSWIAFGPGERRFESSLPLPHMLVPIGNWLVSLNELTGRAAFGLGAVIISLIAVYAWWRVFTGGGPVKKE
jgi:hypothetical protein